MRAAQVPAITELRRPQPAGGRLASEPAGQGGQREAGAKPGAHHGRSR